MRLLTKPQCLVYLGKNVCHDTTQIGSIHWSIMEVPHREYNLCKPQPRLPEHSPVSEQPASYGCKTLNSLKAGLMDEKAKRAAQHEYHRLNPNLQIITNQMTKRNTKASCKYSSMECQNITLEPENLNVLFVKKYSLWLKISTIMCAQSIKDSDTSVDTAHVNLKTMQTSASTRKCI